MYLRGGFTGAVQADRATLAAAAGEQDVVVRLPGAWIGGTFLFAPTRSENTTDPRRRLWVDGLTYAGVPEPVSARDWLRQLARELALPPAPPSRPRVHPP